MLYIASVSSLSADFGPAGAIECLNLTGVFFTTSAISFSSFSDSTMLPFKSAGFLKPLARAFAFATPAMLGAGVFALEEPTLAVCAAVGL